MLFVPQDFYVDHLTRDMDRLMQEIAMYEVQTSAQAGETQEAKAALTEVATLAYICYIR